jgi:hypothetical protein
MSNSLLDLMTKVTVFDLISALLFISIIICALISQKKRISKLMHRWRKDKNEEEDFKTLVYNLQDSVKSLKTTMDSFKKDREHDREDSRKIRNEMYKVIDKQSDGIRNLTEIVVKMQERNSKTKRAEIKEKIERIYRECHPTMTCTDMAFETLKELIEEYEVHGGINSFVHSTVEPEMYEWKVTKKIRGGNSE